MSGTVKPLPLGLQLTWSAAIYDPRPTDLILLVQDIAFGVHKDVLQTNCDYFRAMFTLQMVELTKDVITLNLFQPKPFQILLESFYSGYLQPTEDNIFSLCETAQMLQVSSSLLSKCSNFLLSWINCDSVFDIMFRSNSTTLYFPEVHSAAKRYALAHFSDLLKSDVLHKLSLEELCIYLSDKYLVVEKEVEVVGALRTWFQHNDQVPTHTVSDIVLKCVHTHETPSSIQHVVKALIDSDESHLNDISVFLKERQKLHDIFMFWSLSDSGVSTGYGDVFRVSPSTWQASKYDNMDAVEALPVSDMGTAVCCVASVVYLSGGGNKFGAVNWIRDIWMFDFSLPVERWTAVGKLTESRRHHAMVSVENCLFIFGGFGKFRVRNIKLECFHLSTGLWEVLPVMPEHVVSPAAVTSGKTIYYLGKRQTIYSFNTIVKSWTCYQCQSLPSPGVMSVAMHVDPRKSNSFLGLFSGDGKCCLQSFHLDGPIVQAREECSLSLDSNLTFAGSVISGANMLLFFCTSKEDTTRSSGTSESLIVRSFCLQTGLLTDSQVITGVCNALSIVCLPHIPVTQGLLLSPNSDK
ncbi:kelch protein 4 [Biomphalaria glabrata]|nr:kelch protein 4 [Biomphalaria glabrata]